MQGDSYEAEAIERARRKLDQLRSGKVAPAARGPFWGRIVGGGILVLLGAALPAGVYVLARGGSSDPDAAGAAVFVVALLGLVFVVPGLMMALTATASTPQRALRLFYKFVGKGNARAARSIVVPHDFDDFPRHYPDQRALGLGGRAPFEFDHPSGFRDYWNGLVRYPSAPYCLTRVSDVRVEGITPDIAVVEFRLKLVINTQLWVLLALVTLLIALIVDLATRRRVEAHMRKILIRVGDEWHLFSGEWQGPDEDDVSWLEESRRP